MRDAGKNPHRVGNDQAHEADGACNGHQRACYQCGQANQNPFGAFDGHAEILGGFLPDQHRIQRPGKPGENGKCGFT